MYGQQHSSRLRADAAENTEQYSPATVFTYGFPESDSPTGISQGGCSTNIVVRDHFAVHIPENITFRKLHPCFVQGITTYSPLMKAGIVKGNESWSGRN
ncbi:hypothetical protein LNP25_24000 [Klebsiella variicola subsp. variicola]|nr:hypothetical protein [Klebsiella variicola subsp. variicola]